MRKRLADERGIALIMALGMLVVLSITTVSVITYTGQNARNLRLTDAEQRALVIAEGGLNEAFAVLSNATDPRDPSALPAGSAAYEGGTVSWSGTVEGDTWTVTATSTVPNPTGGADVQETVSSQIRIAVDGVGWAPAWQYVYSDTVTECTEVKNTAEVNAPFYVRGDLCLKNSARLTNDDITVRGKIKLENTSSIGTTADPVANLSVGLGCYSGAETPSLANCAPSHNVHATNLTTEYLNVAKPTVDFNYWYSYAKPGPKQNCTSGSFPPTFDNNTTYNKSLGDVDLTPATSYSCIVTSGASTLGKLVWNASTQVLEVAGVIMIDTKKLKFSAANARYVGRATIYVAGKIEFDNSDRLCGVANCQLEGWDNDANMIVLVAGEPSGTSFWARNNSTFQGGVYAVNDVVQENSAIIQGPIIGDKLKFENYAESYFPPIDFVSYGAPAPIGSTKLVPVSGSWNQ